MFKRLFSRYKASSFLVNVSKLTSGTAIAQVIAISTAPLLYRIFEKKHYGTLGVYMAITGIVGTFSTLQYLQTILLEKKDINAINAMWLNRIINTFFSFFIFLIILFFNPFFIERIGISSMNKWLWFIPVSIFFSGQNEVFKVWANRKKEYNLLTINAILMAVLTPLLSITLGVTIKNETGLFVGLIVGQALPTIILHIGLRKKYDLGFGLMDVVRIKKLAKKHIQFPIYSLPSEFVNRFTNQLPVFMLNSYSGPSAVGVYNLAIRMLGIPTQLIGNAISTVYQQKATEDFNNTGSCRTIFIKTLKSLSLLAIIPTVIILIFGPDLFALIFGEKWRESGEIARLLIVMISCQLVISPLTYVFYIRSKLRLDFIFHIGILITISACLYFGLQYFDMNHAIMFFATGYVFWYLTYLFYSYKLSK